MKKLTIFFIGCLLTASAAFGQTMTNTSNTITLTGVCNNPASGSYTLELEYVDPDNGFMTFSVSCTVASSSPGNYTITTTGITLPTPATNGYWYLSDSYNGSIKLTSGSSSVVSYWYHDFNWNLLFVCDPLFQGVTAFTQTYNPCL